jgi:hypothetical protein
VTPSADTLAARAPARAASFRGSSAWGLAPAKLHASSRVSGSVRAAAPLLLFLALVGVLAAVGIILAADLLARGTGPAGQAGSFGMAQNIPTSFGFVTVQHVEQLAGLTARDLGGMTHGIQDYVPPEQVQIQAYVTLTNRLGRPLSYSPGQFHVLAEQSDTPILPSGANLQPGTLPPNASIDARLKFVVPNDGSRLWLEFRDSGRAEPIRVDLGRVEATPSDATQRGGEDDGHQQPHAR